MKTIFPRARLQDKRYHQTKGSQYRKEKKEVWKDNKIKTRERKKKRLLNWSLTSVDHSKGEALNSELPGQHLQFNKIPGNSHTQ